VVLVGAPLNDDPGANSGYIYLYRPDGSGGYSEQILNASIPIAGVQYGYSVALNNSEVAVVGSFDRNQVHVYQPDGNGGHFETKLLPAGTLYSDLFGHSVAINESGVIAVGAIGDDDKAANAGAVYVYTPDDFGGYDEVKLTASDGLAQDNFGYSVVVGDGGHVVVGAYNDDGVEVNQGAVYVFTPNGSGGYTQTKLTASDADETDQFGHASAVNASGTVVVGVPLADVGGITNSGAIYVYEPDGSGGYAETRIVALDVYPDDRFGYSLDINDNGTIVAGAYNNDDAGANSGSAYVFVPDGAGGYTQYKLTAPDAAAADKFGISVSINSGGITNSGAIYVYEPDGSGGYAETRIVALDVYPDDRFGYSLDINDNGTIVAGAYNNDDAGANSGSAYVFVPDGAGGYTQYKLTAPDAAAADKFGISVSINSDGVVSIGAQAGDGTVADTGAVYTFVPNGDGDYVGYDGTVYGGVASAGLNINGTGVDNSLIGGASDDTISGFAGNDTIAGASGDDVLSGGSGNDTFVFRDGDTGHDTISGFTAGAGVGDVLEFETTIFNDYASVLAAAADVGGDVVITVDANTSVKLEGVTTASLHQDDFQFV
ncbi:hypothetical protein OA90_18500, partial [Labrenzia sp. OB1]